MNLIQSRHKDGRVYVSITRSYREGGKSKSKTYKSLGYHDPNALDYPDKIIQYRALADEMEAAWQADNAPITLEFSRSKKVDMREVNRKNIGYAVLADKYHALELDLFWRVRAQSKKFTYDANAIFRLLVNERCLSPGSKLSDFDNKDWYFDKSEFTQKDLYRSLDFFASYKDAMVARINTCIAKMRKRNTSEVYYDTTNYYFEIDNDDLDIFDEATGEVIDEGLGKRGVSKEHRKSPIVSMGLLMDEDGLPLHYELFSGNTNDCLTALPVLWKVRKKCKLGRVVMVADKGINCSDNIAACVIDGNGYVFSQSVKKSDKELKDWVLSHEGYLHSEGFKCKSKQADKTVYITGTDGRQKQETVPVKYVAFWSENYDKRAKMTRARTIEKASKLAGNQASFEHAKSYGATRYVKETAVGAETGEVLKTLISLDEDQIAEDERYVGYYLIVTSEVDKSDEEIIDIYRELWRIEESFKVTKSDLEGRPVYVWTRPHIEAHFLVCYAALVITRLIQVDFDYKYSASKVLSELKALQCSHLKDNVWHFDYRSEITDALCANAGVTFNREIMTLGEIKDELAIARKR